MAGVKISALPAVPSAALTDIFPVVQGGVTYQESLTQLQTLFNANLSFLPLSGGTMTGAINMGSNQINAVTDPTAAQDAATKNYVDTQIANFATVFIARLATTGALTVTYNNGTAGVGATLTNAGAMAAFALDGVNANLNDLVLIKNQASSFQNGYYKVTTVGSGAANWVLTRTTDYDTPSQINPGDIFVVTAGSTLANTSWIETATVTAVGTDAITFAQYSVALPIPVASGGTGATTASGARSNLSAAQLGTNADITSLTGLTGVIKAPTAIQDSNGNNYLHFTSTASAVNYIEVTNSATGTGPLLSSTGSDSSVPMLLGSKNGQFIFYDTTSTISGKIQLNNAAHTHFTALTVATAQSTDLTLTLPAADGSAAGCALITNASAVLSFTSSAVITRVAVQVFTGSGTYTPTTGMKYCVMEAVGGGGGGGGTATSAGSAAGGGGGGGSYAKKVSTAATVGASQTVTIGAAGTAGTAGNNAGGNGGDTSVGSICVGKGGTGGGGNAGAAAQSLGGAGGVAGTGDLTVVGGRGKNGGGAGITTVLVPSGEGGSSLFGQGAVAAQVSSSGNAPDSGTYGGGGSGGSCYNGGGAVAGGAGAPGLVVITEYLSV
jgi:hypothetical protein